MTMGASGEIYYFERVRIKPKPESYIALNFPTAVGAYVSCVVAGKNESEASCSMRNELELQNYEFEKYERCGLINDVEWSTEEDEIYFKYLAWEVISGDSIALGPINCY